MIPQMLTIVLGLTLIAASARQLTLLTDDDLPQVLAWIGLLGVGLFLIVAGCIMPLWT